MKLRFGHPYYVFRQNPLVGWREPWQKGRVLGVPAVLIAPDHRGRPLQMDAVVDFQASPPRRLDLLPFLV